YSTILMIGGYQGCSLISTSMGIQVGAVSTCSEMYDSASRWDIWLCTQRGIRFCIHQSRHSTNAYVADVRAGILALHVGQPVQRTSETSGISGSKHELASPVRTRKKKRSRKIMSFSSLFDPLFCQEDHFEEEETEQFLAFNEAEDKEEDEDDEGWTEALSSLLANEMETHPELSVAACDTYLIPARSNAVQWVARTSVQHGFSVQTVLLAVNYLDRCFLAAGGGGLRLQEDKPWMGRLAAVACLSLAAKVEETRVPLLLDLQVPSAAAGEEMGYVFENRTIRRMELLLLSTLGWRMNPVTPLSLVHRLLHKIPAASGRLQEVFRRCEATLLAVIADLGWVRYPPSVWAAAALVYAVRLPGDISSSLPVMDSPLDLLNVSKERVAGACQLILGLCVNGDCFGHGAGIKRKDFYHNHCDSVCSYSSPGSPNCVVGSCFKSENSSSCGESLSSSFPGLPPFKKMNTKQITDNGENKELVIEHGVLLA
ncbi:cyclin-D3-2-like, partial [Phalaenopsis equestris]|uniref:cyclin-D3-2-like n=1 Tax=Phalaenopsis equestris TaxID=78828 RepID=UPI0009E43C06